MPGNLLARETSPYLLQHKDNPVAWMAWGPDTLARARAENKPILLSIGYAACHWCHVMAHESFEDAEIADLMNALFVNVKVDREERPDLDHIYQSALALLGQQGGWPLTMFLTPDGEPFWGGTYFPPAARYGRPGFPDVLRVVAETYRTDPDKVGGNVRALREALTRLSDNRSGDGIDMATIDQIAERLVREVDPFHGGIGSAPKFPQTTIFELLWRAWIRTRRDPFKTAVTRTLTRMCQGGIYDHLGGGFARYSTDAEWLAPHFEKMLYDNAQMIDLLTLVWLETRDRLYEARVRETVAWTLREMIAAPAEDGTAGFASTLDADSEGHEGRFYVWSEAEIDAALGADAPMFKAAYDVTAEGNWEGTNILNRRLRPELGDDEAEMRLAARREVLLKIRDGRERPGWDDKVLADWNGLMIAALADAGWAFDEPSWIDAAARAFDFVRRHMTRDGRLRHSWRNGILKHAATLDDHANMARGALALFEATGRRDYLDQAIAWAEDLDRHYRDTERSGYYYTADDAEALIVRAKHAHDNPTPSGNGTMVGVLTRLYHHTGEERFRQSADALVHAFSGEVTRNFFPLATLLNNAELLHDAMQIVIVGAAGDDGTRALVDAVRTRSLPNRMLQVVSPDLRLPENHPAYGKGQVSGRPTAYVCIGMTCTAPITDPDDLSANLLKS